MKLSIVLPNRNQSERLFRHMKEELFPYFDNLGFDYECIIVVNNSNEENERLAEVAKSYLPKNVRFLPFDPNRGKGRAIRRGIEAAEGEYVLFMDADFATDLHCMDSYWDKLDKQDCIVGSRHMKGSIIVNKAPFIRRVMSWGSKTLIRWTFHLKVHDTQCGYKLFKTDVAKKMVAKQITSEFAFDLEYLYYLKLNGYKYIEIPVRWTDDPDSTIKSPIKTAWAFYKDMMKIRRNKKHYKEEKECSSTAA